MQRFSHLHPRNLHKSQLCHIDDRRPDRILFKFPAQFAQQRLFVLPLFHINKVYEDDAGKVTNPDLSGRLLRRLDIDAEKSGLAVPLSPDRLLRCLLYTSDAADDSNRV